MSSVLPAELHLHWCVVVIIVEIVDAFSVRVVLETRYRYQNWATNEELVFALSFIASRKL